jgi:hypothetical protein
MITKRKHEELDGVDGAFPINRLCNDVLSVVLGLVEPPERFFSLFGERDRATSKVALRLVCKRWDRVYREYTVALSVFPAAPRFDALRFVALFPNLRRVTLGDTCLGAQYDAPRAGEAERLLQVLPELEQLSLNFVVDFSAPWTQRQTKLQALSLLHESHNSRVTFLEQGPALAAWIGNCPHLVAFELGADVHSVDSTGELARALEQRRGLTKLHLLSSQGCSTRSVTDDLVHDIVRRNPGVEDVAVVTCPNSDTLRMCAHLQRLFVKTQLSSAALPPISTLRELHVASLSWGDFRRLAAQTSLEEIGLYDLVHDAKDTLASFDDVIHFLQSCRLLRQWHMPQVSSFLGQRLGAPRELQEQEQERNARQFLDACRGRRIAFSPNIVEVVSLFDALRRGGAVRELNELVTPAFFSEHSGAAGDQYAPWLPMAESSSNND